MKDECRNDHRLQELYEQLADVIPQAMAEDFVGKGYAKGQYYDSAQVRILVVERIPRPDKPKGCGCQGNHRPQEHQENREDERDFTPVVSRVVRELLGVSPGEWQDYTAWTYLYKLAPKAGKADDTVIRKQKALCNEIINQEIQVLRPTHVLFLTGWGSVWDFDLPLSSLLKGEAVEGWGESDEGVKMIVTRYAVRKPEDKFAMDVVEKIRQMGDVK